MVDKSIFDGRETKIFFLMLKKQEKKIDGNKNKKVLIVKKQKIIIIIIQVSFVIKIYLEWKVFQKKLTMI